MTQTTTTTLDTRQRRLEERHTLEDAAAIIEHVSIENRSVNQLRTLEAAAAIQRKRDARNSAARERRLRQRRSAEARAQLDALDVRLSAEHQQRERERIERIQQLDAARDALRLAALPKSSRKIRQHGVQHERVERRGRLVVEVQGEIGHRLGHGRLPSSRARSGGERLAAAACVRGVRVVDLEARTPAACRRSRGVVPTR